MSNKRVILCVVLIAVIVNNIIAMRKLKARREAEWQGLTESEVRSKLDAKLPGKVPAEKRQVISDKVVSKMRDRGMISEDSAVHDDAADIAADEAQPAEY